jgi:hypothetical protein
MTTERERDESATEPQHQSQGPDEVEASISALEKAMLGAAPIRDRKAIHELGCRIVAQAIKNND